MKAESRRKIEMCVKVYFLNTALHELNKATMKAFAENVFLFMQHVELIRQDFKQENQTVRRLVITVLTRALQW